MQKLPKLELRRRPGDEHPTIVLFGVSESATALSAEAYHVHQQIKRPVLVRAGKARYTLPKLPFGFAIAPLELSRG